MKERFWVWLILLIWVISTGSIRANDDSRAIGKLSHGVPGSAKRSVSIYLTFNGDKADGLPGLISGNERRFYDKVWDGLYLQVTTETGESGIRGYMFTFSKDEADQNTLTPSEPMDVPTLREVAAVDFRTDDNFAPRPLQPGPGKPKDRGALRIFSYPGFEGEIRVLDFDIGDAQLGKKPYFKSLSCLVTLHETGARK
ncbi:MAG TPA: hypothetical protein VHE12_05615 [bacterium]|nr:hypothetical protein [bacterium]